MPDPDPELAHPEAAWVPGTLDPDDAEWFAGRLPSCPDCRAAVAEFGQVPLCGAVEPLPGQGAAQRPPRMERPRLHRPQRKLEPGRDLGSGRAFCVEGNRWQGRIVRPQSCARVAPR